MPNKINKKTKLLKLLKKNDFFSLEKISKSLIISPTETLKQIRSLRKLGYDIDFVKKKGYHLISKQDIIIPEEIKDDLNTDIIGKDIFYFKSISSTNIYAKNIAEKSFKEGIVVIADIQTHGRGRKNRLWLSPSGGLWFSVILRPKIIPEKGMLLTMAASIAVAQAIKKTTGLNPVIKWPNDILINKKKVCGILTEFVFKKNFLDYAVVGIGINVNNKIDKKIKKVATSLSLEVGLNILRVKFLKTILKYFDEYYKKLNMSDFKTIKKLWFYYNKSIGKKVKIEDDGKILYGVISDIDDYGFIILKTKGGIYKICSGDLSYL